MGKLLIPYAYAISEIYGHARIRKLEKRDSETGMSADSETVIRKLGQHDSETGPARIRKLEKHDSETGMSADSETVIRKLEQHDSETGHQRVGNWTNMIRKLG